MWSSAALTVHVVVAVGVVIVVVSGSGVVGGGRVVIAGTGGDVCVVSGR